VVERNSCPFAEIYSCSGRATHTHSLLSADVTIICSL
jgi:hypothetical protein